MKITLTSHAANHLLRLAEGLQSQNALNRFYTIYPRFKLSGYHIEKKYLHTFRTLAAITFLGIKTGKRVSEKLHSQLFDYYVAMQMRFDRSQPDLVQGNSGFCLETLRIAKKKGIKTIVDRACPHIDFQLALLNEEIERLTGKQKNLINTHQLKEKMIAEYHLADGIIVPSTYSYNSFIAKGFDPSQLHLVPLMKEKNVTRCLESKTKKEFTVLAVGFNFYRKGFYYLLKAWHALNLPQAKLVIRATIPKEFQHLLNHDKIIAIQDHLSTPDLIRYYQACDVFCLPSIDEGFGMAAVEGMAAAKPIIITENVGMKDLITHKKEGFILPIRNIEAIQESITTLYENRELAKEMGEAAYRCEQEYSHARYIQTIMNAYKKIIQSGENNDIR